MKASNTIILESIGSSIDHYNNLLNAHGTLVELQVDDNNMRSKLISIQVMMIPHLEVMQREIKTTQDLIIEDHNLLVVDSLIDLATRLHL